MEEKNIIKNEKLNLSKKEKCRIIVKTFPKIDKNILQKIQDERKRQKELAEKLIINGYFPCPNEFQVWIHKFYELELLDGDYLDKHELIKNKKINDLTLDETLTKLTFFIRQDRFCTGLIVSQIENGIFEKLVKRLNELTQ